MATLNEDHNERIIDNEIDDIASPGHSLGNDSTNRSQNRSDRDRLQKATPPLTKIK